LRAAGVETSARDRSLRRGHHGEMSAFVEQVSRTYQFAYVDDDDAAIDLDPGQTRSVGYRAVADVESDRAQKVDDHFGGRHAGIIWRVPPLSMRSGVMPP
jgi:hypothetical protein